MQYSKKWVIMEKYGKLNETQGSVVTLNGGGWSVKSFQWERLNQDLEFWVEVSKKAMSKIALRKYGIYKKKPAVDLYKRKHEMRDKKWMQFMSANPLKSIYTHMT